MGSSGRMWGHRAGPHLMVSTSMVYGFIIDVFNTESISVAECSGRNPLRSRGTLCSHPLGGTLLMG